MESNRTSQEKGTDFQLVASSDDDFGAGWKECKSCLVPKPLDSYNVEKRGAGGRKAVCKDCTNKVNRSVKIPVQSNDRIQQALEAAAYRYIKEIM